MNIRGIELLRELKLTGPRKELITKNPKEVDLDWLFEGAERGVTIMVFDRNEPIDQNPLYEKNVSKYHVKKEEYLDVLERLTEELESKGVKRSDMSVCTHQS